MAIDQLAVFGSLAHQPPNIPDERILIPLSLALWRTGRVSEAVTGFRLLDRGGALPVPGILAWGWWLLYDGGLEKAEELFSRAVKMEPDSDEAILGLAFLCFCKEDYSSSRELFSSLAIRGKYSSPVVMVRAATALAEGRRPDEVQLPPLFGLPPGLAHLYKKRLLDGREAAIAMAREQIPLAPPENLLPVQRLALEWQFEDGKADPTRLRAELEELLKDHPGEGRLWQFLGMTLHRLGMVAESNDAFWEAIMQAPLDAGTWAGHGANLAQAKDYDQAHRYYETAVFLDPNIQHYRIELAACYGGLALWQKAEETLSDAVEYGASAFALYLNRAICRLNLNEFGGAMADLRAALEIDPAHPAAAKASELLELEGKEITSTDDRFRFGDL